MFHLNGHTTRLNPQKETLNLLRVAFTDGRWIFKRDGLIVVFIQKWPFKTYFLFSQHCFFLPVPPNLTISLQDLQSPQSACWHTSHTPHRFLRGAVASLPSIWSLKKMSNMCRTRGVVVAWIKWNKVVIKCIQDVTFSTYHVTKMLHLNLVDGFNNEVMG